MPSGRADDPVNPSRKILSPGSGSYERADMLKEVPSKKMQRKLTLHC